MRTITFAAALLASTAALASEPVKLTDAQMDHVTAGGWMLVYNYNFAAAGLDPYVRIVEMQDTPVTHSVVIGYVDPNGTLTLIDNPGHHYPDPSLIKEHSGATSVSNVVEPPYRRSTNAPPPPWQLGKGPPTN